MNDAKENGTKRKRQVKQIRSQQQTFAAAEVDQMKLRVDSRGDQLRN